MPLRFVVWSAVIWCAAAARPAVATTNQPTLLYLNDCKPTGCVVKPGTNDARTDTSSLVTSQRTISPFAGTQATWDAVVACVSNMYAPFGIDVVTTNPGSVTPHYEAMIAGTSPDLGLPSGIWGISPWACSGIKNAITFTFANVTPDDVLALCWTAAQESAHAFGLEHSMTAEDAMTYITSPPQKSFVDVNGCIGTQGCCQPSIECQCGRTMINSYRRLLAVLGPHLIPPTVAITAPADGEAVLAGFAVEADVTDPDGVALVELSVDGTVVATLTEQPFRFTTDPALAIGEHTIAVRAEDLTGASADVQIHVTREPEPDPEPEPEPEPAAGCGCEARGVAGGPSSVVLVLVVAGLLRRRRASQSASTRS